MERRRLRKLQEQEAKDGIEMTSRDGKEEEAEEEEPREKDALVASAVRDATQGKMTKPPEVLRWADAASIFGMLAFGTCFFGFQVFLPLKLRSSVPSWNL